MDLYESTLLNLKFGLPALLISLLREGNRQELVRFGEASAANGTN